MNKKLALKIIILCLISALISGFAVYAATPTTTFSIFGGNYPGAPSYTVFTDGSNYFAKDALGVIAYTDSDLGGLINTVIDAVGVDGCEIFISKGEYSYSETIEITNGHVTIKGEGRSTDLVYTGTGHAIVLGAAKNFIYLEDFSVGSDTTDQDGIHFNSTYPSDSAHIYLENVFSYNHGRYGFLVRRPVHVTLVNCRAQGCLRGYWVEDGTTVTMIAPYAVANTQLGFYCLNITGLQIFGGVSELNLDVNYGSHFAFCNDSRVSLYTEEDDPHYAIAIDYSRNFVLENSFIGTGMDTGGIYLYDNLGGGIMFCDFWENNYGIYVGSACNATIVSGCMLERPDTAIGGDTTDMVIENNYGL